MKKLFIILLILVWSDSCFGATYTVCASGCDEPTIQAVFDNNDLAPADIVEIQADTEGGSKTYAELVTVGANDVGDSNAQLIVKGRSGDTVTISGSGTRDYCINASSRGYITFQDLTLTNATVRNFWADNVTNGFVLDSLTMPSSVVGIWIRSADDSTVSNCTLSANTGTYGIYFSNPTSNITCTGNTVTTTGAQGISFADIAGLTSSNNTVSGATTYGMLYDDCSGTMTVSGDNSSSNTGEGIKFNDFSTGLLNMNSCTVSGNSSDGINLTSATFTDTSYIDGCTINGNGGHGVYATAHVNLDVQDSFLYGNSESGAYIDNSTNINIINCDVYSNDYDGVSFKGSTSGSSCIFSEVHSNGSGTQPNNYGDGITCHDTNATIVIANNIIRDNDNTGIAHVGASSGVVYNNVIYSNGSTGSARGGIYVAIMTGGSGWQIKNNICKDNFPYEIFLDASGLTYTTFDYNCYSELNSAKVATVDNGSTDLSWATYNASYESNSINSDPLLAGNYKIPSTSPAYRTGTFITGFHDTSPNNVDYYSLDVRSPVSMGIYQGSPTMIGVGQPMTIGSGVPMIIK